MCQWGVWLRPNQSTMERIRAAFAALKTPYFRTTAIMSRGRKSGPNPWQTHHAKAMDSRRGATKNSRKFTSTLDRRQNDEIVTSPQVMSLLNVPSTPFPPVFSSPTTSLTPPTASPTSLTGIRSTSCATPLGDGPSGHLADPIPNTGSEPKFCIDVSSERTPMNLPNRNMSFQQEYDATVTASEDLNLPQHSEASSSKPAYGCKHSSHFAETRFNWDLPLESVAGL